MAEGASPNNNRREPGRPSKLFAALLLLFGTLLGSSGVLGWLQFRHQAPITEHQEFRESFEAQIKSAEARGDNRVVARLREEHELYEEMWRAQFRLKQKVPPVSNLIVETNLPLRDKESIRELLEQSEPLLRDSASGALLLASGFLLLGDYESAVRASARALQKRPNYPEARLVKGTALLRLRRPKDALVEFQAVLAVEPQNTDALGGKAGSLTGLRRFEEALRVCDETLKVNPDHARTLLNRSHALNSMGRFEEGLAAANRVITLLPDSFRAQVNRSASLANRGRVAEARKAIEIAIELNPHFSEAHYQHGAILSVIPGEEDKAIGAMQEAIRLDPNWPRAHAGLAQLYADAGRYDEALDAVNAAISLDPNDPEGHAGRASVMYDLGDYEEALRSANTCVRLQPDNWAALAVRVLAFAQLKRYEDMLQAYELCLQFRPETVLLRFIKGMALAILGKEAEAISLLRTVFAESPGFRQMALADPKFREILENLESDQAIDDGG